MTNITAEQVAELRAKATQGRYGHDKNGHVAVIDFDQWGITVAMPPHGLRPPYSAQVLANMDFFAAAHDMADLIASQDATIKEQAARIAELEPNATRYWWLRSEQSRAALILDKRTEWVPPDDAFAGIGGYWMYEYRAGDELDAAIDAAIVKDQTPYATLARAALTPNSELRGVPALETNDGK